MQLAYFLIIPLSLIACESNKRILLSDATYVQQLEQTLQNLKAGMADVTAKVLNLSTTVTALKIELDKEKAKNAASDMANVTAKVLNLSTTVTALKSELDKEKAKNAASDMAAKVLNLSTTVTALKNELDKEKAEKAASGSGGIYVRWGRRSCPVNTSELLYSGYAGSSWYTDPGAATNYLCLVPDPEHYSNGPITPFIHGPHIFGVEYYIPGEPNIASNDDATCSVCRSYRSSVIMMPGRKTCYPGWTTEYSGYIVASDRTTAGASQFVCLDNQPEPVPHGTDVDSGGYFEIATYQCGSLTCPPYKNNEIVACVVCSK